ncbi:putative RNA-directed DNA polymerase [Helianthus annuus]|nr:putative RNA-directed DNA polymerase [Helianthus annuus]
MTKTTESSSEPPKPTSLHPAYSVTNIHTKIRTLDGTTVTYSSWTKLFNLHVVAYKVANHIDETPAPDKTNPDYPLWKELDALVLQWIYSTVSDDLLDRILETNSTARDAWVKLEKIFLSNKKARAAALETRFCNLTLTACSSLDDYCKQLKSLANQLADVDHSVSDSRLVLQLVRGLPAEYSTTASFINNRDADWDLAISLLHDEAIRIDAQKGSSTSVLLAPATAAPAQHSAQPSGHSAVADQSQDPGQSSYRGRGRGRGRNNRGGRSRGGRSYYSGNGYSPAPPSYPNWAWWTPPPCPYPTQNTWRPNTTFSPQQPATQQPQAHFTGSPQQYQSPGLTYDALSPSDLSAAFAQMQLQQQNTSWNQDIMDTGAGSHVTRDQGKIILPDSSTVRSSILVGNGNCVPIQGSGTGFHTLPNRTYILPNVLYSPHIIRNLIFVRRFTRDNNVSIEFDPFGFSLKDLITKRTLSRHNSTGDLYPFTPPQLPPQACFIASPALPWHDRLGHPGAQVLDILSRTFHFSCNKDNMSNLCNSCQLANSKRLPFHASNSFTFAPFDIIHCDLWTSPIPSKSGYKYYMVLIDNFSHFVWVYPLKFKSEAFPTFTKFHRLILTQFNRHIKTFQCDLGGEFDNHAFKSFASHHGLLFRFSCPQTSSQNGRAERMIRRLNDIVRALLIHANLPPSFWVEALHTATYLHNILPTKRLNFYTPTFALYLRHPDYEHLRVFGCACYPNTSATQPHKLHSRAIRCIFLGYPPDFRGYRCFDPTTGKVHISRHVTFDEHVFPYSMPHTPATYKFLDDQLPLGFTFQQPIKPPSLVTPFPFHYSRRPRPNPPPQPASTQPNPLSQPNQPMASLASGPQPSQPAAPGNPPPHPNQHPMTTRSKSRYPYPPPHHILTTDTISPVPKTYTKALADPNWLHAMQTEFSALQENETWELVPRPTDRPIIRCMWLFRHKFRSDGSLERYKARLVVNGNSQTVGVDCEETFSPVVKPATIRTVLSLAVSKSWPIHQLHVKNAFLHGTLNETVFMHQPPGFVDRRCPDFVCRLKKSLYGLKQAPRAWYTRFATFITSHGFKSSACDHSLFIYQQDPSNIAYLLLYVDDIVLTASNEKLLQSIIGTLSREFAMTDLGRLHHFLGIKVDQLKNGNFLSQQQYAKDIISRASMTACKPCTTPVDLSSKLSASDGSRFSDPTLYRSLAGALQYLTFTSPDISYAVQQICLFMHDPRDAHYSFMKRIIRYIQGTIDYGIRMVKSRTNELVGYSDADWGGCPDSRRSTSGYCVFLGDNLISWSSKRQPTVSRSSAEAEYRGVANVVAEATWIRNLLLELHTPLRQASIIYCDNVSAVYLSDNPVQHQRTKHIEIDIHFVRDKVRVGDIRVLHVPSSLQYADIFTKGLSNSYSNHSGPV